MLNYKEWLKVSYESLPKVVKIAFWTFIAFLVWDWFNYPYDDSRYKYELSQCMNAIPMDASCLMTKSSWVYYKQLSVTSQCKREEGFSFYCWVYDEKISIPEAKKP
jgi:hypothetical protein